jgi:hypothetical protein
MLRRRAAMKRTTFQRFYPLTIPLFFFVVYYFTAMAISSTQGYVRWSTLFQADFPRVLRDLTEVNGNHLRTNVHPIYVLLLNPIGALLTQLLKSQINAVLLMTSICGALSIYLTFQILLKIGFRSIHALIFSLILGFSAAHWLFSSMPETYIFTIVSLMLLVLIGMTQAGNLKYWIPAGVFSFGMLTTNIALNGIIYFFSIIKTERFKNAVRKTVIFLLIIVIIVTALSILQKVIYPSSHYFFMVKISGGETKFVFLPQNPAQAITRAGLLIANFIYYNFSAPEPMVVKDEVETQEDILLFNFIGFSRYPLFGKLAVAIWSFLILASIFSIIKFRLYQNPLWQCMAACLLFNFGLHTIYGEELFLYVCDWTFFALMCLAIGLKPILEKTGWISIVITILLLVYLALQIATNINFLRFIYDFLFTVRWSIEGW